MVSENVSRVTPEKKDAAPIRANAPGSSQSQFSSFGRTSPCAYINTRPIARPYRPPMYLHHDHPRFLYLQGRI